MRWPQFDKLKLETLAKDKTNSELESIFKRSYYSVVKQKQHLKLLKQPHRSWEPKEVEFLELNYLTVNDTGLGTILNRSRHSIRWKLERLNLKRNAKAFKLHKAMHLVKFTAHYNPNQLKLEFEQEEKPKVQRIDIGNGQYILVPEGMPQHIIDTKKKVALYKINL